MVANTRLIEVVGLVSAVAVAAAMWAVADGAIGEWAARVWRRRRRP